MKDKDKKKFRLGDIIQKLNEGKASPDDAASDEPDQPLPEPSQPAPRRPSFFASGAAAPDNTPAQSGSPQLPPAAVPPVKAQRAVPDLSPRPVADSDTMSGKDEDSEFDIMRYVGILVRRKNTIIAVTIVMGLFSLFSYLWAVKYYSAHARMLFSPGYQDIMSENTGAGASWTRDEQKFNTHLELLKSQSVLKRVSDALANKVSPEKILLTLTITRGQSNGEKNDIVDIAYRHTDPKMAQDVVNQICREYIDYMKEVNVQDITRLIVNLEDQIGKVQGELDTKENSLREFKENNRTVQLSTETNITISKLSEMELALQKTELDMLESRERLTGLKKEITQQDINVIQSMTYSNPFQAKLAELELELNSTSAEYSPEHFKVKMIKGQIDKIKEAMKTDITQEAASRTLIKNPIRESLLQDVVNISIEKSANDARRSAQEQIIKQLDVELSKLPTVELQFAQLTRETESLVQVLKLLKTRFEEAKIKRDSQESDLKILEWAQLPDSTVSNMNLSKVLMGLLIGFVIGIALAFLIEFLDQSIKDPQNVEKVLELPLLGIVPLIEMEKALIDSSVAKWKTILEPFRALRATLKHLASTQQIKTFIICSAVKGEGKTTLAANLAITFALDGKKVILVDGDLRRAQMHTLFNLPKKNGLADFLLGTSEAEDIIKKTVHDNLFVITAGEHPQNPAELIGGARFGQLVTTLRAMADYVIFDSPALLPVSDGMSMAPKIEACIMVVRALWTPMKAAQQAKNQLKRIGITMIGAVLNGISHSRGYYPYYYGYYRYYAYKYTYEEDNEPGKRNLSIREIGLSLESRLKSGLQALVFAVPHYTALLLNFAHHLLRKKTFWILLAIMACIPFLPAALRFFGAGTVERNIILVDKKEPIRYLGSQTGKSSLEAIAPGQKLAPAGPSAAGLSLRDARDTLAAGAAAGPLAALSDSLRLWQQALNEKNVQRYLSFYDTARFKYPGGGFSDWKSEKNDLLLHAANALVLVIDSIRAQPIALPFFETDCDATVISGADSTHREYSIIWQQTADEWRIVREKYRE
jgi:capsular exopolysaccharide synthesis family protein